jgi:hypothetical protein
VVEGSDEAIELFDRRLADSDARAPHAREDGRMRPQMASPAASVA